MYKDSLESEIDNPDLQKLPHTEQEIFNLRIIRKKSQRDISKIFNMTQGAVSHRLSKIRARLSLMKEFEALKSQAGITDIEKSLSKNFNPFETELLKTMLETSCQSETAVILNSVFNLYGSKKMNQIKVRHCFLRCLNRMKKMESACYPIFELLSRNLYMFHEVKLPHFYRRPKIL
jgi:predicted transcriptional regulator